METELPVLMTFYRFMQEYPHTDPDRVALAAHMKQLAKRHTEVKKIDSLVDLKIVASYMTNPAALRAVEGGTLWCEYCAACNHPL